MSHRWNPGAVPPREEQWRLEETMGSWQRHRGLASCPSRVKTSAGEHKAVSVMGTGTVLGRRRG